MAPYDAKIGSSPTRFHSVWLTLSSWASFVRSARRRAYGAPSGRNRRCASVVLASLMLTTAIGLGGPLVTVAGAVSQLPGSLWTVQAPDNTYQVAPTPTGNVLVNCPAYTGAVANVVAQTFARDGSSVWSRPSIWDCAAVVDARGNTYIETSDAAGNLAVESLDTGGQVRWMTSAGVPFRSPKANPVLGANGSVYVADSANGYNSSSNVFRFDTTTGAQTFSKTFDWTLDLYAYAGGLAVVTYPNQVNYVGYDGTAQGTYSPNNLIGGGNSWSSQGTNGTVYVAGHVNSPCAQYNGTTPGMSSVTKITPSGIAWVWTEPAPDNTCRPLDVATTPDGGVVFARGSTTRFRAADLTYLDASGTPRWTHQTSDSSSSLGGYWPPRVDANGVVALASAFDYSGSPCSLAPPYPCTGLQVEFLSQQSGAAVLPTLQITDPPPEYGAIQVNDAPAIDTDRLYLLSGNSTPTLAAFVASGLGVDYRLALQSEVTSGGKAPPPPPPSAPPQSCGNADAVLIGVRGSGDNNHLGHQLDWPGRHALSVAHELEQRFGVRLYTEGVDYDGGGVDDLIGVSYAASSATNPFALPSYPASLNSGVRQLLASIDNVRAGPCGPNTPILLVGFSQGAHVIQSALDRLAREAAAKSDKRWRSVAGVALLASPRFDPKDPVARGSFAWFGGGIAGEALVSSWFSRITQTYCVSGDPVCVGGGLSFGRHTGGYDDRVLQDSAGLLATMVRKRQHAALPPPHPLGELAAQLENGTYVLSAGAVYARGAPVNAYSWDFTSDGHIDQRTPGPWVRPKSFGAKISPWTDRLTVTVAMKHDDGTTTRRQLCVSTRNAPPIRGACVARLSGPTIQRAGRTITVAMRCRKACTVRGTGALSVPSVSAHGARSFTLGPVTKRLRARRWATIRLQIPKRVLRIVKRALQNPKTRQRVKAKLTIRVSDGRGKMTLKRTVRIRS